MSRTTVPTPTGIPSSCLGTSLRIPYRFDCKIIGILIRIKKKRNYKHFSYIIIVIVITNVIIYHSFLLCTHEGWSVSLSLSGLAFISTYVNTRNAWVCMYGYVYICTWEGTRVTQSTLEASSARHSTRS